MLQAAREWLAPCVMKVDETDKRFSSAVPSLEERIARHPENDVRGLQGGNSFTITKPEEMSA